MLVLAAKLLIIQMCCNLTLFNVQFNSDYTSI
jgi:hypothetical protein